MAINSLEPVVPSPPLAQTPSTGPDASNVAVFKKYGGDWTKANEGYFNVTNKLSEVERNNSSLAERNKQLESYVASQLGVGGGNADFSNDPLAPIQRELGLPIEPFRNGIRAEVEAVVGALFNPIMATVRAEETLASEIDNFEQLKGEARRVMASTPEVAENFNAMRASDPVRAWKYAIREAALAKASGPGPAPPRSAGLPGSAVPQGRGQVNPDGPSQQERESAAWDYHRQFGDAGPALHERFKGTSVEQQVAKILERLGMVAPTGGGPQGW
jgi:hypothetical protein